MTAQDDPDNIYFEATFQFIKGPYTCRETRRRSGPGGQTSLALEDVRWKDTVVLRSFKINFSLNVRLNAEHVLGW